MRVAHLFVLLWLTICQGRAAELSNNLWGPAINNVRMSIGVKTGDGAIKINDPVVLTIVLTNVSADVRLSRMFQTALDTEYEDGYSFLIVSPSGKQITARAPNQRGRIPGNQDLAAHAPGYPLTLNLSKLCRFDEAGDYTITATGDIRMPNDLNTLLKVVSNPLTIKLVGDK
jgi:hypothetical protein